MFWCIDQQANQQSVQHVIQAYRVDLAKWLFVLFTQMSPYRLEAQNLSTQSVYLAWYG